MTFRLTNTSINIQHFINNVLIDNPNVFWTAYLDDILVYSVTLKDIQKHIPLIFMSLRKPRIFPRAEECEFHIQETKYLELIIFKDGIKMDHTNVNTVRDWELSENVKDVQAF